MPWCEDCSKYWAPSAMNPDGTCPTCGREIETPSPADDRDEADDAKAPWHFKLMIVALVGYLSWRFLQLFGVLPR